MKGGNNGESFNTNCSLLESQETWFRDRSGICSVESNSMYCEGGGFSNVGAGSIGSVGVYISNIVGCTVKGNSESVCTN